MKPCLAVMLPCVLHFATATWRQAQQPLVWFIVLALGLPLARTQDSGLQPIDAPPAGSQRTHTVLEWFVSPNGTDTGTGSESTPFATLGRARDALRSSGKLGQVPLTVHIASGIYYLPDTLILTEADSGAPSAPVLYRAQPGGEAIISGGLELDLKWEPYRNGIMQAKVQVKGEWDQLFINGERQHMARYPNYDPHQPIMHGYAADAFSKGKASSWTNPEGGYMHAMHPALWGDVHFQITGKRPDGELLFIGGWQNNRGSAMHKEYRFVENIFEELDAPGEWFYNSRTGVLYYQPVRGLNLSQAKVELVRLRHLIEFQGTAAKPVKFITLQGLTFRHSARTFMDNREPLNRSDWTTYRGGTVLANGTEDCQIQDCTFDQVGGNTIFVSGYNRRFAVHGSLIQASGANGVAFVGEATTVRSPLTNYDDSFDYSTVDRTPGPLTEYYPADCLVEDCLITQTGRFERQTAGVQISMSRDITVRHCSIYDMPRAGINISEGCWGGHLIEFCDVFDTVKETGDHGSFNSWGRDRFWHPDIKIINRIVADEPEFPKLDMLDPNILRNNRWRCDRGWDIDLDDGSSDYLIYNNLCLSGGIKNREGYRRTVTNNIVVNNTFHPHVWLANSGDVFKHNIVMGPYRPALMPQGKWGLEIDHNLFTTSEADRTKFAVNACDSHSLVGDPLFQNPVRGDYRVSENSPAVKIGFHNFPMDQFGVRKPALQKLAKTPEFPQVITSFAQSTGVVSGPNHYFCHDRVRNIEGLGDRSAFGLPEEAGVLLLEVTLTSALGRAGLMKDDVIVACNGRPVRNVNGLLEIQSSAAGKPLLLSVIRQQKPMSIELRDYADTILTSASAPQTNSSSLVRVKAHAPSFLYGTGSVRQEGDLKKQPGDNIRWKGPGTMEWLIEVAESGDYEVRCCYASVEGSYGQELQLHGDSSLTHKLVSTKGVFGQGFMAYEMIPIEGVLKLAAGNQTISLSALHATSGMHLMDFRSLELTPVAAKASIEADRLEARRSRASTAWLPKEGFGLMFHWTSQSIGKDGTHKPYAQAVSDFPLERFAQMVQDTGARYVLFTVGHAEPYCPAPLRSWEKHHPGKTTQRDLIAEMADALNAKNIELLCYLPAHVIGKYPQATATEFNLRMTEVLKEFGERYRNKVVGYWFDGFYQCYEKYPNFSFPDFFKVCKSGNSSRIIALNSWIYPNVTEWQEYWAGETASPVALPKNGTNERGPGQGLRYQALLIMQPYWVQEKVDMPEPRFTPKELHDYIKGCMNNGGAVTINLGIYQDGSVDPKAVKVLKEVHQLLENGNSADSNSH